MTFYDNHDMPRMDADDNGFIDANNWLFTSRGIPVVYYGSEIGFRAGADQHAGNRDFFGQDNIQIAKSHPVRASLARIAAIRKNSIALQRGLQVNLDFGNDTAAFYRVYQKDGVNQTALVLLNKGDDTAEFEISDWVFYGQWRLAGGEETLTIDATSAPTRASVPAHGVTIYLSGDAITGADLKTKLQRRQARAVR